MIKSILFIISFLTLIYFIAIQFVYAQTVENEIIENTLERVEKTTASNSEITESNNASESTEDGNTPSDISKQDSQSESKIYESQNIGVKFKMPSTWSIFVEHNSTKDCFYEESDKIFIYRYYTCEVKLHNKVSYPPDFGVKIEKHSKSNYSLVDFLTLVYEDFKHLPGYTYINDKNITIQNNPAWQIEFSRELIYGYLDQFKQMYIATKVNNTFYSLTYEPRNSSVYSKYLPEFENFIKSIEFIPSIEPKPSFLKYSTLKNAINNNETIEQTQVFKQLVDVEQIEKKKNNYYDSYAQTTTSTTNNITDLLFDKYYPIVKVAYESDSTIVLEAKENYLSEINGSLVPFWESMDVVKNQGYSLNEITILGTGSIENPIIFYAIFFNNSNNKIEK